MQENITISLPPTLRIKVGMTEITYNQKIFKKEEEEKKRKESVSCQCAEL